MINYKIIENRFKKYIDMCLKVTETKYLNGNFSDKSLQQCNSINEMIMQKYNHTIRVVMNINKLANKMGQSVNFKEITKTVALLHDFGRFNQAIYLGTFNDNLAFKNKIIHNHAELGSVLLQDYGFKILEIPKIYRPAINESVLYHQANSLPANYNIQLQKGFERCIPENVLTGSNRFNEFEQKIIALLLQMLRDVDKVDILYQRAIGEIKPVPEFLKVKNIGVDKIAKLWGISEQLIKEFNENQTLKKLGEIIKIPTSYIPLEKLVIDSDVKERFLRKENIQLKELQSRENYSFITAIWWSIFTFLSDVNFVSNLETINESDLLNKIYLQYPEKMRPLIDEAFEYAKEVLVNEAINASKGQLYVRKK